jgi:hypothetical protein
MDEIFEDLAICNLKFLETKFGYFFRCIRSLQMAKIKHSSMTFDYKNFIIDNAYLIFNSPSALMLTI